MEDKEKMVATHDRLTRDTLLADFDEYLRRRRGLRVETRGYYAWFADMFLKAVFPVDPVVVTEIHRQQVLDFLASTTRRYRPGTVGLAASVLRSFFRFLRAAGLREDRLEDAVPALPHRRAGLVRHLDPARFEQLLGSLDSSSPRGLRDRAIVLTMARLGLRAVEIVQLRLEDIDWRNGLVRVSARKTGRGAVLPLIDEVGTAMAEYLQHARPDTRVRQLFVLHRQRVGAPISRGIVRQAVTNALRHAGIEAPVRGGNLLRHSLATELLDCGAGLIEIADLFGHSSLASTQIYAAVDVAALRQVALPWPVTT
jgi:integrase/recombinase XerD